MFSFCAVLNLFTNITVSNRKHNGDIAFLITAMW